MSAAQVPELLITGPLNEAPLLLLAPGAGAPMTSPWLERCANLLAERRVATARFEFAYMAARRTGGNRRPPPRADLLVPEYRAAVDAAVARCGGLPLFIGGKSLGGRVASLVADDLFSRGCIGGLVCLGYPFHPIGKPDALRTAHLEGLRCPAVICQGERDPFGVREEVQRYGLSSAIRVEWIAGGDHDFAPRRGGRSTREGNISAAADRVAAFMHALAPPPERGTR